MGFLDDVEIWVLKNSKEWRWILKVKLGFFGGIEDDLRKMFGWIRKEVILKQIRCGCEGGKELQRETDVDSKSVWKGQYQRLE